MNPFLRTFIVFSVFQCMSIPTLTLSEPPEELCPHGDYETDKGICCNKCSRGQKLLEDCNAKGQRSKCVTCPDKEYTDQENYSPNCNRCGTCKGTAPQSNEVTVSACQKTQNTVCRCKDGYYKKAIDSEAYECLRCTSCGEKEKEKRTCESEPQHFYTTRLASTNDQYLNKIIAVFAFIAPVSVMVVVLVTYVATKRFTKKKLLKRSNLPSDGSPDPCEQVLVHSEEPSDNMGVTAVPQSPVGEQEPSNLPDCIPLEIKTPDLIYTVLDLVPVLQVKQLVRSLGVKDAEIEQAEMDHRSCREAHYQMLRVWAERGSHAGAGGRGGMMHWHLLQELLDEVRKMHLGHAAEELETKYGIQ
uniref:Tumor necrosis factor receptor superfamily, member 1a n=1 Tax=Gasterosteus aculeatus aculeatus TaxID=481459 RepID=A0AAQ4R381_GASAC